MPDITKRHRELAFTAIGATGPLHEYALRFIETGDDPSNIYPTTARIAKTFSEFEAEVLCHFALGMYVDIANTLHSLKENDERTDEEREAHRELMRKRDELAAELRMLELVK